MNRKLRVDFSNDAGGDDDSVRLLPPLSFTPHSYTDILKVCTSRIPTSSPLKRRPYSTSTTTKLYTPTPPSRRRPSPRHDLSRRYLPHTEHATSPTTPRRTLPNENPCDHRPRQSDRAPKPSPPTLLRHLPSPPPHGPRLHRRAHLRRRSRLYTSTIHRSATRRIPTRFPASTAAYEWTVGYADRHTTGTESRVSSSASSAESSPSTTSRCTCAFFAG